MKDKKIITEFGAALNDALEATKNDVSRFVWKGKDGKDVKLIDLNEADLQKAYTHTTDMLYNTNKYLPGRYVVKQNIKTLIGECNAELLCRYLLHECDIDFLKTNMQLIEFLRVGKSSNDLTDNNFISELFSSLPQEFETVTIGNLMSACLDKLGVINRKMISDKFILSQGIWLTDAEKEDLTELDGNGKPRNWLDVIKERLLINPDVNLRTDYKGFTYEEFRSLLRIESLTKISKLPSKTLRTLRDKAFVLLDVDTDYHINKWLDIKSNIEAVAATKGYTLIVKEY